MRRRKEEGLRKRGKARFLSPTFGKLGKEEDFSSVPLMEVGAGETFFIAGTLPTLAKSGRFGGKGGWFFS